MKYSPEQLSQQTNLFLKLLSVERNLSNRTLKAYRSDLQCFMLWCKNTQIETLDQNTILSYFHYLQTTLERKASSIQRKYISIRQFFSIYESGRDFSRTFFPFFHKEIPTSQNNPPYSVNSGDPLPSFSCRRSGLSVSNQFS